MTVNFSFSVAFLLSVWSAARCDLVPEGVYMECHDRYFMIAVDLFFIGEEPRFKAVDKTGMYAITEEYAAKCGYTISVLPLLGHMELRASYFSCHTDCKDGAFSFSFNLIVTRDKEEAIYALNKTCTSPLPWSPREVTCEVSVRSDSICTIESKEDNKNSVKTPHSSTTSDWQVTFHRPEEQIPPMNLSQARKQGYEFDSANGRLVFRTPYGQPSSFSFKIEDVPVEAVHATMFSRQNWVVLMVDLLAACSMDEGSFDDSGYMIWKTPEVLYPSFDGSQIRLGLGGELVEQQVAEKKGYTVEKHKDTVHISIPYDTEGGYRKSFVNGSLYEFYVFDLCLEQILEGHDSVQTMVQFRRILFTPLLPCLIFIDNQTILEEHAFTVYLGDVPEDVELVSVQLNGKEFRLPLANASTYKLSKVSHLNHTYGYTLRVPFHDPVVIQKFFIEDAVLQYKLDINYTLTVLPGNDPYYHLAPIVALFTNVFPPAFDASCSKSGIRFKLDHQPLEFLWKITIGPDVLTSELADRRGYIMSNDSQSLLLDVPLFTHGYEYQDITLMGFSGTFKILVRDQEKSEVQASTVKTCLYNPTEFILCSPNGTVTVVTDLPLADPRGGKLSEITLMDKSCRPKDTDGTRILFSFPVNGCGAIFQLGNDNVTYQNEILYKNYLSTADSVSHDLTERVLVQCTYPLSSLHQLFTTYKFVSDTVGFGKIIHTVQLMAGLQHPTTKPTTIAGVIETTPAIARPIRKPVAFRPGVRPSAQYFRIYRLANGQM